MRKTNSVRAVMNSDERYYVKACRAEGLLDELRDGCVSLIVTDPPYFKVKDEAWDRAWKKPGDFLAWIGGIFDKFRRVLAPNGSLYVFASPQMAWGVEGEVRRRFEVLNAIRWEKQDDNAERRHVAQVIADRKARTYFPTGERIIFAEQFGADSTAPGASGYDAKCDELRGFVFEPIRAYLDGERERARLTRKDIDGAWQAAKGNKGGMSSHWFSRSQWALPTRANYEWLRALFNERGDEFLRKDYEFLRKDYESLREQYESLREQYESLRRPFYVSADVPYTDVWTYPTAQTYSGKHACEKPWQMGLDIVRASSRPGDLVLDCFAGSGCFPAAAVALGRRAIACDMSCEWADATRARCERALENPNTASTNRAAPVRAAS